MTNALAQNIETTDKTSAIDVLMQSINTSSNTKKQEDAVSKFSNLMNNLDARTQKAQKEFNKKAKVTNTSSINKKALEKKATNLQNNTEVQAAKKDIRKTEQKINISQEKIETNNFDKKTTIKQQKETTQNVSNETNKNNISENNTINNSNNSEELSDINNSSPVETSPVFSSEETTKIQKETKNAIEESLEQIETSIEELIENIPLINEGSSQIQDLKNKIEDLLANFEDNQKLTEIVSSIETALDNTDLSQNQGEEILNTLNEVKELFNSALKNVEESITFSNAIANLKEQVREVSDKITTKLAQNEPVKTQEVTINISSEIKETKNILKELETLLSDKNNQEKLANITETLDVIVEDSTENTSIENTKLLDEIQKDLSKALEKVDSVIVDESKNVDDLKLELNEKLNETLKNLKEILTDSSKITDDKETTFKSNIIETDFTQNATQNNEIKIQLDKLTSQDFKNIDSTDKKSMDEILNTLQTLEELTQSQDIEVKNEIENIIKQINENNISKEELTQAIDNLADEIKIQTQENETNIKISSEKTIDITTEIKKFNNNQNFSQNQNSSKENMNTYSNQQEFEIDLNDITSADFENDLKNVNLKEATTKNIDIKNVEQNLQKAIYTQELMEEMMVEVDVKTIPSHSGALSVADEVAKLAIGESNALNPITSAHGSVTYDSMGANAIIKNAASLMKSAQPQNTQVPSMEDILNQVSNKITQLKDNSGQKLTMVLRPNDLGRLSIELTQNQNGLITQIMAQNDEVRAYIERNIDSLRQQLADSGVNVNSIQIKTAGQEGSTQYDGNQNLNREQQENLNQQQSNKDGGKQQQNQNNKNANEILSSISNYDMQFNKDFSSILNKTLNYSLN